MCEFFECDYCTLLTVTYSNHTRKFIHKFYYYVIIFMCVNFSGLITVCYLQ